MYDAQRLQHNLKTEWAETMWQRLLCSNVAVQFQPAEDKGCEMQDTWFDVDHGRSTP